MPVERVDVHRRYWRVLVVPLADLPATIRGQPPAPRRVNRRFPAVRVYEVERDALVVVGEQ